MAFFCRRKATTLFGKLDKETLAMCSNCDARLHMLLLPLLLMLLLLYMPLHIMMMQLDCCEMVEQKKKNCRRNNTKQKETYLNCNYIVTTNRNNVTAEKSHWMDVGGWKEE